MHPQTNDHPKTNSLTKQSNPREETITTTRVNFLDHVYENREVNVTELIKKGREKKDLGLFYKIEKKFFYKEKILAFYLLNYLIGRVGSSSLKSQNQCKLIQQLFFSSIKQFQKSLQNSCQSNHLQPNFVQQLIQLQKTKQKLILLIKNIISSSSKQQRIIIEKNDYRYEQFQSFLDILVESWIRKDHSQCCCFQKDIEKIFREKFVIENVQRDQKITQIIIGDRNNLIDKRTEEKHLLYKNLLFRIGQWKIAEIIQTNQQKYVFFNIFIPKYDPNIKHGNKSKISQLFEQKHKKQVIQSQEEQRSQSNSKSEIIKDDQFYRISSKISTSFRKNSFNQGENLGDDLNLLLMKNYLYDSLNPALGPQHNKLYNPNSEIFTRSSSLEKSSFLFRDNLSTSIDLLMRLQLETEKRRKKSCENVKISRKSIQKEEKNQRKEKTSQRLKINLVSEYQTNLYEENFEMNSFDNNKRIGFTEGGVSKLGNNRRLGIARSFFRQNIQMQKK